jgi:hypothetical protein
MATTTEVGGWRNPDWPASRTLAVIGGVFGIVVAILALGGVGAGMLATNGTNVAGLAYLGSAVTAVAVVNVILAILVFISAGMLDGNMRLHGALLVLWGVIGLFFAFGLWFGAVLVIIGGALAYTQARGPTMPGMRRSVT